MVKSCPFAKWSGFQMPFEYLTKFTSVLFRTPFENWKIISPLFKGFCYSDIHYSDKTSNKSYHVSASSSEKNNEQLHDSTDNIDEGNFGFGRDGILHSLNQKRSNYARIIQGLKDQLEKYQKIG